MPRYEPYKSRYKGNYTRQIKNESKEINLKKPLIISVVFIIFAAVIFSIIKNYSPVVDIAIKDFFSINHREALALESDGIEEDSDKLSFLSNIPLFSFFIKSDTNQTLSVMAYETNSKLEATLSENESDNNFTNSNLINRESLLPFFNENFNTNYNSSIYRENQNNNIDNAEENKPYNYIEQMIIDSRKNDNSISETNNKSANNNSTKNNSNNIFYNSSTSPNSSIFEEILKPKENSEKVVKTMKPASTSFSSQIPNYMQNKTENANNNLYNKASNNYNNYFKDIEYKSETKKNNNDRERIINATTNRNDKKDNNSVKSVSRKNIIEETIFNNQNFQKTSDYDRVINDMVNPNLNNNIVRDNNKNNLNDTKNNINREEPVKRNDKIDKKEIMKKANNDVAKYKIQKANNKINRDFNNIKTKSKDEGIYLVEYNESSGAITLIFRNRNFKNEASIENAIKTLLNGATDDENNKNIISCIPKNTQLLDIFVEDDTVYLNFNEDFEFNPLGNEGTMIQIYQLVYTATQFEGIDKVIFLIDGNLNETIGAEGSIENTAFTRF